MGLWRVGPLEACGVGAAFSSRLGGVSPAPWDSLNLAAAVGDEPARVRKNRIRLARAGGFAPESVARAHQVHGTAVLEVDRGGDAGTADALITDIAGVTLAIGVADCAAIFLADPRHRALGLCHAGWRGTVGDIVGAAVAAMARRYGSRPDEMHAAVSPTIGPCCYEVDEPVSAPLSAGVPWGRAVLAATRPGHARLDLWEANRRRLLDAGLRAERIHVAGICTACHPDTLFSHRRDAGRTGRMQASLWLDGSA